MTSSTEAASSVRGKLQFAETHTFSRTLAANIKGIQDRASGKFVGTASTDGVKEELNFFLSSSC